MDLGITNRVAMVAAASKGLGRACAEALAGEGALVSICSRSGASIGVEKLSVVCDVTKGDDLQRWFDETVARFARVDILVTNTGGPPAAPMAGTPAGPPARLDSRSDSCSGSRCNGPRL